MGYTTNPRHVRGDIFTLGGKWKYEVALDYTGCDWEHWDLCREARVALRRATDAGISGVSFREVPAGCMLVVLEPYSKHSVPIAALG